MCVSLAKGSHLTTPMFSRAGNVNLSSGGGTLGVATELFRIKYTASYSNPEPLMLSSVVGTYVSGICPGSK